MSTWVATLLISLFLPSLMIAEGVFFKRGGPKQINHIYGYRTHRSMLNEETWRFAHRYCGNIWFVSGLILLPLSIVVVICLLGQKNEVLGVSAAILCSVQIVVLVLGSLIPTERALRRTFDRNGNRK